MSKSTCPVVCVLLSGKSPALLDVLLEVGQASGKQFLLFGGQRANGVDLLNTVRLNRPGFSKQNYGSIRSTYAKLDVRREEVDSLALEQRALDEGRRNDTLFTAQATEESIRELGTGVGHGQGSASSTIFSLYDFITAELNPMHELLVNLTLDGLTVVRL